MNGMPNRVKFAVPCFVSPRPLIAAAGLRLPASKKVSTWELFDFPGRAVPGPDRRGRGEGARPRARRPPRKPPPAAQPARGRGGTARSATAAARQAAHDCMSRSSPIDRGIYTNDRWVAFSSRSYSHRIISVVSSSRLFSPKQTNSSGRMRNYVSASLEGCSRADRRCLRARRSACGDDCPPCAISSPGVGDAESSYCLIQSQLRTKERREALCCAFPVGPRCPHARVSTR